MHDIPFSSGVRRRDVEGGGTLEVDVFLRCDVRFSTRDSSEMDVY